MKMKLNAIALSAAAAVALAIGCSIIHVKPCCEFQQQPIVDGGTPPDSGTPLPPGNRIGWLHTQGNKIYRANGTVWQGRGVNLMDTRSCNACSYNAPDKAEVMRRADEAIAWGATFLRLNLESYASSGGRVHWAPVSQDASYLKDVVDIVRHIGSRGVHVEVSLWQDPSIGNLGHPTAATADEWRVLANALAWEPFAIFGVVNEPESNYDGAQDAAAWTAMNNVAIAIRQTEDAAGSPRHLIAVQGTRGWARVLEYYISHPIQAEGGLNIIYETHVYNAQSDFHNLIEIPAQTLPVIVGEFGPVSGFMTAQDADALVVLADSLNIPWLAWAFHMRCEPNLLVDNSSGGCGIGMPLQPTSWGSTLRSHLQ